MNVRLKYDLGFTAGVYYDNKLRMNNYSLRLWMTTNCENSADQNTSLERIKYFIYSQIDSTIFINKNLEEQSSQFAHAGLDITTMPGDPVDQLVGIMLYYKLNAIAEDRMIIMETEIDSSLGENMTYLHSDFENPLGYVQPGWWTTPDLIHSDIIPVESEKIVSMPSSTSWRDLEMTWADTVTDESVTNETGNIVVFADFKQPNETK
jgi:hypothetical protein